MPVAIAIATGVGALGSGIVYVARHTASGALSDLVTTVLSILLSVMAAGIVLTLAQRRSAIVVLLAADFAAAALLLFTGSGMPILSFLSITSALILIVRWSDPWFIHSSPATEPRTVVK